MLEQDFILPADIPLAWKDNKKVMAALFGPRRSEVPDGVRVIASVGEDKSGSDSPSVTFWALPMKPGAKRTRAEESMTDAYAPKELPSPGDKFEEALRIVFFAASKDPSFGEKAEKILRALDIRVLSARDFCFGHLDALHEKMEER